MLVSMSYFQSGFRQEGLADEQRAWRIVAYTLLRGRSSNSGENTQVLQTGHNNSSAPEAFRLTLGGILDRQENGEISSEGSLGKGKVPHLWMDDITGPDKNGPELRPVERSPSSASTRPPRTRGSRAVGVPHGFPRLFSTCRGSEMPPGWCKPCTGLGSRAEYIIPSLGFQCTVLTASFQTIVRINLRILQNSSVSQRQPFTNSPSPRRADLVTGITKAASWTWLCSKSRGWEILSWFQIRFSMQNVGLPPSKGWLGN